MAVSILELLGGSSANTDRKATLTGYGQLEDVFNTLSKYSTQDRLAGALNEGRASKFWDSILSGDPAAVAAAVAPEASAARKTQQTELKQLGEFGNRSGGTTAAGAQAGEKSRGDIINAILSARGNAAGSLSSAGGREAGRAVNEKEGTGQAASALTSAASQNRVYSYDIHQDAAKQWADLVGQVLQVLPIPGA